MRITTLLISSVFLLLPLLSQAEQALSKPLITSFVKVSQQLGTIYSEDPELISSLEEADFEQPEIMINTIKNSKSYSKNSVCIS